MNTNRVGTIKHGGSGSITLWSCFAVFSGAVFS